MYLDSHVLEKRKLIKRRHPFFSLGSSFLNTDSLAHKTHRPVYFRAWLSILYLFCKGYSRIINNSPKIIPALFFFLFFSESNNHSKHSFLILIIHISVVTVISFNRLASIVRNDRSVIIPLVSLQKYKWLTWDKQIPSICCGLHL